MLVGKSNALESDLFRSFRVDDYQLKNRVIPAFFTIAICCYVLVSLLSLFGSPVNEFDDAIPLVHGVLVQQGKVPNLNFYSIYPPLGHYISAAAFNLFGRSVISPRIIGGLLYIVVVILTARLFRGQFPGWLPLVPACTLLVAASIGASAGVASWPGSALAFVALLTYLVSQSLPANRLAGTAVAGLLTGAAILYRINFGGYVLIVIGLDILLKWWSEPGQRWTRGGLRQLILNASAFVLPLSLACCAFCFLIYGRDTSRAVSEFLIGAQKYMLLRGFIVLRGSSEFVCFVTLPSAWFFFRILLGNRAISAKSLVPAAFAICNLLLVFAFATRPSIAFIALIAQIASVLFLHLFVQRLRPAELSLLLYFCCQLHYYISRSDWSHSRWLLVVIALLLPYALLQPQESTSPRGVEPVRPMGSIFAALIAAIVLASSASDLRPRASAVLSGMKLLALRMNNPGASDGDLILGSTSPSPAWSSVYPDGYELAALRFLRAHSQPNDPIFVGVGDHSRVFWNDLRIYWLAGRPIGVRTFQLETRSATEPDVQSGIIADLERNRVTWLILNRVQVRGDDTFAEEGYKGSSILDRYVGNRFHDIAQFGPYAVLRRIEYGTPHR
jgi:4-amino-4-deoxy-L-arabinose transferase-like glycosyltransferase